MKVIKDALMNGRTMNGHIEFGVFLKNGTGDFYYSENGAIYGYMYNCICTRNRPRAIEEIKRK